MLLDVQAGGPDDSHATSTKKCQTSGGISLVRQGLTHYAVHKVRLDMLRPVMAKFGEQFREQRTFRDILGLI